MTVPGPVMDMLAAEQLTEVASHTETYEAGLPLGESDVLKVVVNKMLTDVVPWAASNTPLLVRTRLLWVLVEMKIGCREIETFLKWWRPEGCQRSQVVLEMSPKEVWVRVFVDSYTDLKAVTVVSDRRQHTLPRTLGWRQSQIRGPNDCRTN
ncbi:hypothetical protein BDZ97DRAFT_2064254 [Flammula alnicola]|nr:hypothetical protein BDZ97DRAFT_2064254 [Flammula alnicola]